MTKLTWTQTLLNEAQLPSKQPIAGVAAIKFVQVEVFLLFIAYLELNIEGNIQSQGRRRRRIGHLKIPFQSDEYTRGQIKMVWGPKAIGC